MDWSKIKTIFIITFLVLNVYLMYEYFNIKGMSQERELFTRESIDERLKADDITISSRPLPKEELRGQYISAKPKVFKEEDLDNPKLDGQDIILGKEMTSFLDSDKPLKISNKFESAELDDFIKNHILFGDEYRFWEKRGNTITYYQKFGDKLIYQNKNGKLTFLLNEDNKIVSYTQTYLEDIEEYADDRKLIQPIKAIEILYENHYLLPQSEITDYELGYHTYVDTSTSQTSISQVLTPAWRFEINGGEENLFVHGLEGQILELNKEETKKVE
ncbi:two-component system regulatory protein YycI [Cytobacillus purgationiresistens]|uniref:Regulatory protein YycI of two-component signal transduction system YycFG n=1 Tax=Cytobacillus purgationiresistens TaxID=863449 RepID=A0ABU0AKZ5_9BACI|nr:two-component system regulatory protein YycI [Cytobacillus purgationiresistens]MDQ0271934.1 regulatory protein YycI of two-component signal transduction system YycFG [Cytobacillus purgationiresistens]